MVPTLAARIRALDATRDPTAWRFDTGAPFAGRVAVLPAAYNPPTLAHLHLLELGAGEPGISAAAALLSTRNVDKGVHGASLAQRVEMLRALAESEGIAVLATNQARLADQSEALTASFPGVEFDFIVGYDTLVRVFDDRYYARMAEELAPFFDRHRLITTNRAQHSIAEVERFIAAHPVARSYRSRILPRQIDDEPASYSSSASRAHASGDGDLPQLPGPVAEYIRQHGLYRETQAP